jgi:phosphatidylglycerol:prolipoprotein diacylglycerol transferase
MLHLPHPPAVLAYYLHNLNPIIFALGPIKARWYGFAYLMGFLVAYLLIRKLSRDGMLRLAPQKIPDLVLNCCIFGVLVGGRLGFVLFYDLPRALHDGYTPMLWHFYGHFPYWDVLNVMGGGMSAHGGVVFTILVLIYFGWRHTVRPPVGVKLPDRNKLIINLGDAACMVVPVGLCFGRIANFINGELYGRPTTVPWAVQFPSEIYAPTNDQMNPAVAAKLPGVLHQLYGPYVDPDTAMRMLIGDLQKHSATAMNAVRAILPPRHPSQLYEALLEGVLLFIIVWTIGRLWRKDGMASGAFLTFYPIMRIIGEQFRVGDNATGSGGQSGGLSAGVIYSLLMIVPGLIFWTYWIIRDRRVPWIPQGAAGAEGARSGGLEALP